VRDWRLARDKIGEYYGEYAASLALLGADLVKRNSKEIGLGSTDSIRTLVEALISDGVAAGIAGSSRPCSGSEHLFSHAIDLYGVRRALHGEQVGVGTIIMSYLHGLDYDEVRNTLIEAKAPTNYKELKIYREDIISALVKAKEIRPDRYTILNEVKIDKVFAEKIAKKTGVI
jgi:glycerol-1-phosphate dehydrogenase [NAD(P)+]